MQFGLAGLGPAVPQVAWPPAPLGIYTEDVNMVYPQTSGSPMHRHTSNAMLLAPAGRRWSRSRERSICPRRHLRVLPTRTRPSLFASD